MAEDLPAKGRWQDPKDLLANDQQPTADGREIFADCRRQDLMITDWICLPAGLLCQTMAGTGLNDKEESFLTADG